MSSDFMAIGREIKKKLNVALKKAANDVAVEMQKDFNLSMNQFYYDYKPRRYKRTHSTFLASSGNDSAGHFADPSSMVSGGDGTYTVELIVDGSRIPEGAYPSKTGLKKEGGPGISAAEIFSRVWDQGIHGFTWGEVPDYYIYYRNWTIPPKTTPPDEIMAVRFGHTSSGEHLNSIVSKYLKF